MNRPGQKVKTIHRLEQAAKLFSLILASAQALCDLDYKALSVYFLMAGDSYCLFPETQINGFVKSTFSTAHISHPLGICLKVQASYMCFKRSVLKQIARKLVTWILQVNWGAACKDMRGSEEISGKWGVTSLALPQHNNHVSDGEGGQYWEDLDSLFRSLFSLS